MNNALQKFAAHIIPSDEYLREANECATAIKELLQSRSKFGIGRVCFGGSSGKKTTIIGSDIDCVLFINEERPPFKNVLSDFENILTRAEGSFNIKDVRTTRYSIQFKALKFEFDFPPAVNFTEGLSCSGDKLIDNQKSRVLAIVEKNPRNNYMYSSSLTDAAVRFMKQQSGFVNEMVRIAKFWYKALNFGKYTVL